MGTYATLAQIANYQGEFEKALSYFDREQQLCREMAIPYQLCVNLSNLGDTKVNMADYAGAHTCYQEALSLARALNASDVTSNLLAFRGFLAFQTAAYERGEQDCREALGLAEAAGAKREQAFAWLFLGHNLLAQQRLEEARAAYLEAVERWQMLGDSRRTLVARAGLARVALARGETAAALEHVSPILTHIRSGGTLHGAEDPIWLHLTCYHVLQSAGDPHATACLEAASHFLSARVGKLTDAERRQALLGNVPSHRTLQALLGD